MEPPTIWLQPALAKVRTTNKENARIERGNTYMAISFKGQCAQGFRKAEMEKSERARQVRRASSNADRGDDQQHERRRERIAESRIGESKVMYLFIIFCRKK
jgi:hypothetical protein